MKTYKTIAEYIKLQPKSTQATLKKINAVIKSSTPKAQATIKYAIPTYTLDGKNLVHFAGFKNHIGFFPTPSAIVAFKKDLTKYHLSKGTIQFPLDKPVPLALIKKIVRFRVKAILEK